MHLLGHALNLSGERAYMVCQMVNEDLYTPRVDAFPANGEFIGVYPEIVEGNPLSAHIVVRYILNYPGRIGTENSFNKKDIIYTFFKIFYPSAPVMTLPIYNPKELYEGTYKRTITTVYRGKDSTIPEQECSKGSVEINYSFPKTHFEVLELFRKSKVFYIYGLTGMINEAIMCGCPVVALYSFEDELGDEGVALNIDALPYAQRTLHIKQQKIMNMEWDFWKQLDIFIRDTQERYEYDYLGRNSNT